MVDTLTSGKGRLLITSLLEDGEPRGNKVEVGIEADTDAFIRDFLASINVLRRTVSLTTLTKQDSRI